ncbi:MAG: heparinase II/III family protein [Proteobacteria bacterium]|nr:heparinase II/III family protein [Pseudomonadota bacterium]
MPARARRSRLRDFWNGSPFYSLLIGGRAPARLTRLAPPPLPGVRSRGEAIVAGKLVCAGRALLAERPDWIAPDLSEAARIELNSFDWLDDLATVGNEAAQTRSRALVEDWIAANPRWQAGPWDAEQTGHRLAAWLAHAPFLSRGDGDRLGPMLLDSACRQARHLSRGWTSAPPGVARLAALKGLVYAHACGLLPESRLAAVARVLGAEAQGQLLDDGFHAARGPGSQYAALAILVDARLALEAAQAAVPETLHRSIEQLAPAVRFFRHGDGGLALFENSNVEDARAIDEVLARAQCPTLPPERAANAGFERVAADRTLVLLDAGAPPAPGFDAHAHAGTLSVEISVGRERIIVNCGAGPRDDSEWSLALRATAAHSTLTLEDTSSSEPVPGKLMRRPPNVKSSRDEADGNVWLEASHDGYVPLFGFLHVRRLFVAGDGRDVRGEDSLVPAPGAPTAPSARFALRFHLDPGLQASIIQNGAAALLRTHSGQAWRLQVAGAVLEIGESVSFGVRGSARRAEQLVAAGTASAQGVSIKWALKSIATARSS